LKINTPLETVRPIREGRAWRAVVARSNTKVVLERQGWSVVEWIKKEVTASVPVMAPEGVFPPEWAKAVFDSAGEPEPMDLHNALKVTRNPLPDLNLAVLRRGIAGTEQARIAVVMVVSSWEDTEIEAVEMALDACSRLGAGAHVVLVQNNPEFHAATKAWKPLGKHRARFRRAYSENKGFAAACNLGAKKARDEIDWLLFTQSDCTWGALQVIEAVELSTALWGVEGEYPIVGPSGGTVDPSCPWTLTEVGRNIGEVENEVKPVDFVAGYWFLVRADYFDITNMDDGFPLFYEDPDFCLRMAFVHGVRSIVWPSMKVSHERGSTMARLGVKKSAIRDLSVRRFAARWR